jgi:hypothetical protein
VVGRVGDATGLLHDRPCARCQQEKSRVKIAGRQLPALVSTLESKLC